MSMHIVSELWLCTECMHVAVNGEVHGISEERDAQITRGMERLGRISANFDAESEDGCVYRSGPPGGCACCQRRSHGTYYRFAKFAPGPCPATRREYSRLRSKGWHAEQALRGAKVTEAFRALEAEGLVRLSVDRDDLSPEDAAGDVDREAQIALGYAKGVWRLSSERYCECCDQWCTVDSVGGFIGENGMDSGYDHDLMQAAIDAVHACRAESV